MAISNNSGRRSDKEIFFEALEKATPDDRAAFLDQACGDDPLLRQRVEELLANHFEQDNFMHEPAIDVAAASKPMTPLSESPGSRIGRYKLLQAIGEGGMGVVYMAEQEEPVRRRVALKIIKLGMDTKAVVARFEAERQALALMDHPNIARVLDGGATETGRPYFVMELVQGVPITEFCDKNHLSAEQRLKLFIPICQAIQSAHQKGIIHRDLKPTNILVTLNPDGSGFPKIIDFGVAKATSQKLTEKTLFTAHGMMVGTPAYMSPEQAEMSQLDVDTRADIYSLGALLYELLTGTPPFSEQRLRSAGYNEMQRIILEEQPLKPSTRLSTLQAEQRSIVARNRGASEVTLGRAFPGDLDWIVMKCLEKDRARRYETANGLAHDIERHLRNEPITARPPSRLYEFQKTLRRHWVGFVAAAAVLAALTMGVVVSTLETLRARRAELRAQDGEGLARRAEANEAKQKTAAQLSLYKSLLGEARATRLARKVGYRDQVFAFLKQAKALDVPERNLADLRREAIACLGDFLGLTPVTLTNFSTNITHACLDPAGNLAAFGLMDGTIQLREMPSGRELPSLSVKNGLLWGFGFNAAGDELFAVVGPLVSNLTQSLPERRICAWARDTGGRWQEAEDRAVPGATKELFSTEAGAFDVILDVAEGPLVIGRIDPGSPAEKSHFQIGDKIVVVAGIAVAGYEQFTNVIQKFSGHATSIIVERGSNRVELAATPAMDPVTKRALLGVRFDRTPVFRLFSLETKAFVPGYEVTNVIGGGDSFEFCASGNGAVLALEVGPPESPNLSTDVKIYDWKTGGLSNRVYPFVHGGISLSEEGNFFAFLCGDGEIYALGGGHGPSRRPLGWGRTEEPPTDTGPAMEHIRHFGGIGAGLTPAPFCANMVALPIRAQSCIRLWNLVSREDVGLLDEPEVASLLSFSPHGNALLTVGQNQARFYRLSAPEKVSLRGHIYRAGPIAFSPNGGHLASVANWTVRVCDSVTGRTLWETHDLPAGAYSVSYSPDGQWVATGYWNSDLVTIWDAQTGQRLLELGTNGPGPTWSLEFSSDGRYLATATDPHGLRIWRIEHGQPGRATNSPSIKLARSWSLHQRTSIMSAWFAPDSRSVAFWGWNTNKASKGQLYVWDFDQTAQPREVTDGIWPRRQDQSFTPDGRSLLTWANGILVAVDVASGKQTPRSAQHLESGIPGFCLSPDGSKLAVISRSALGLNIRNPENGALLYSLPPEPGAVHWVAWSPDSRRLAVSRDNGNIAIWDLETVNQILAQLGLNP
jgi:serine/threonine protein kinase/WD40 repeat protein